MYACTVCTVDSELSYSLPFKSYLLLMYGFPLHFLLVSVLFWMPREVDSWLRVSAVEIDIHTIPYNRCNKIRAETNLRMSTN